MDINFNLQVHDDVVNLFIDYGMSEVIKVLDNIDNPDTLTDKQKIIKNKIMDIGKHIVSKNINDINSTDWIDLRDKVNRITYYSGKSKRLFDYI